MKNRTKLPLHDRLFFIMLAIAISSIILVLLSVDGYLPPWVSLGVIIAITAGVLLYMVLSNHMMEQKRKEKLEKLKANINALDPIFPKDVVERHTQMAENLRNSLKVPVKYFGKEEKEKPESLDSKIQQEKVITGHGYRQQLLDWQEQLKDLKENSSYYPAILTKEYPYSSDANRKRYCLSTIVRVMRDKKWYAVHCAESYYTEGETPPPEFFLNFGKQVYKIYYLYKPHWSTIEVDELQEHEHDRMVRVDRKLRGEHLNNL